MKPNTFGPSLRRIVKDLEEVKAKLACRRSLA